MISKEVNIRRTNSKCSRAVGSTGLQRGEGGEGGEGMEGRGGRGGREKKGEGRRFGLREGKVGTFLVIEVIEQIHLNKVQ